MINVNLKKELSKIDEPIYAPEEEKLIGEVKLILQNHDQAKREVLRDAGLDHLIRVSDQIEREKLEKNKLVMEWGKIYTKDEIKNLCLKYRLRFLPSKMYRGNLDTQLAQILLDFKKDKLSGAGALNYGLFIMAPAASFNLTKKPIPPRSSDPAIFWRIDDNHYKLLHVWGDDFSRFREVLGVILQNEYTYSAFIFGVSFITFCTLFTNSLITWGFIGIAAIAAITAAFIFGIHVAINDAEFDFLSENNWESEHK